jgi:hypothetical protein
LPSSCFGASTGRKTNYLYGLRETSPFDAKISDNEGKPAEDDYICFIPGLIHIARDGVWSGFEDFIQGIQDGFEHLKRWYILLRASKAIL